MIFRGGGHLVKVSATVFHFEKSLEGEESVAIKVALIYDPKRAKTRNKIYCRRRRRRL